MHLLHLMNFLAIVPLLVLLNPPTLVVSSLLSTVAISRIANRTVVCGLVFEPTADFGYSLNCTSISPTRMVFNYPSGRAFYNAAIDAGDGFLCVLSNQIYRSIKTSVLQWWTPPGMSSNETGYPVKRLYSGPPLVKISVGGSHVCGVTGDDRRLECWRWRGDDPLPNLTNVTDVAAGRGFVCVLLGTGEISCYGNDNGAGVVGNKPRGKFTIIAAGDRHVCGLTVLGSLDCWGVGAPKPEYLSTGNNIFDGYKSVAVGDGRTCALHINGTVVCWGDDLGFSESLRRTKFLTITARGKVFCGVERMSFSLFCWGGEEFNSTNSKVFDGVLPAPCVSSCSGIDMSGSARFCPAGTRICMVQAPSLPFPDGDAGGLSNKKLAFMIVGSVCFGVVTALILSYLFKFQGKNRRRKKIKNSRISDAAEPEPELGMSIYKREMTESVIDPRVSGFIYNGHRTTFQSFSFQTLLEITDGFSERMKIGTGSFGSVYRAVLSDSRRVAIKRAEKPSNSSGKCAVVNNTYRQIFAYKEKVNAFVSELALLSGVNHRNLVRLIGYCCEDEHKELVLVYEYMANGTVHDQLHKFRNTGLASWKTRIKVALDAARGIEYLHSYTVPAIIHRDIKSSNIILDDKWTAKVSDFGHGLVTPTDGDKPVSLRPAGTIGYMDPEYYRTSSLTTKSDVYSFGVVLLELLTGRKAVHRGECECLEGSFDGDPRNVIDFAVPEIDRDEVHNVLDQRLPAPRPSEIEAVQKLGYLAAECVRTYGRDRPDMKQVVSNLEKALDACTGPPWMGSVRARSW